MLRGRSKTQLDVGDQLRAGSIHDEKVRFLRSLRESFCLLAYASESWLGHTSDFIENFDSVSDSTSDVASEPSGILQDCLFDRWSGLSPPQAGL
jgi:hypothetical protein